MQNFIAMPTSGLFYTDPRTIGIAISRMVPKKQKGPPQKMTQVYDALGEKYLAPRPGLEPGTCGLTVQVTN